MSALFSEVKVGGLHLENRIAIPPMCQYQAVDGCLRPWHYMHVGSMAISGAALVIMESTGIEALGRISPNCLGLYTDEQEAGLTDLVRTVKSYAHAKLGIQLNHAGRKASTLPFDKFMPADREHGGWDGLIGPSNVKIQADWGAVAPMDEAEIARVIGLFAEAAARADRCGFDAIELHGAHGYLVSQFLSPMANNRTDRYGGSLENRMRFGLEVAEAVRTVWPHEKALGIKLNATDWIEGGIDIDETVEFSKRLRDRGVDFATISSGGNSRAQKLPPQLPNYQVGFAEAVKKQSGIGTMAIGMIVTPQQAEDIIADGKADMVGVARACLDDPRWPLHAAQALGVEPSYPDSYWRLSRKMWPGYDYVHTDKTA